MYTENNEYLEKYLKTLVSKILAKHVRNEDVNKFTGYLPVYKKVRSGRCLGDKIPDNIRGSLIEKINNSIIMFVNNKYSINICDTYILEILDLHYSIKICAVKDEIVSEKMLTKKGFNKLISGIYFMDTDYIVKHKLIDITKL